MVLHKEYVGFANVRISWIPQELGQAGELRLTKSGQLLHRIYQPNKRDQVDKYLYIPIRLIDRQDTWADGCEAKIVTLLGYHTWFRFTSDAEAVIFARLLFDLEDLGEGYSLADWRLYRQRLGAYKIEYGAFLLDASLSYDEDDVCWLEPWTLYDISSNPYWETTDCQCHDAGYGRYNSDYTDESDGQD